MLAIFSSLGAVELSVMLAQKKLYISKIEAAILGVLPPSIMILIINFDSNPLLLPAVIAGSVSWLLIAPILFRGSALDNFINRFVAGCAVLLYPGMLLTWLVRMSHWDTIAGVIILVFLCTVFAGDSAAWAAGKLFGKGNQGVVPASPNKSVAGFIGGTLASIGVGMCAAVFWPEVFVPQHNGILGIPAIAGSIIGLTTGVAATLGDLGESAIKRSSGIKDSGHIIPGRGGVLDSLDSVSLAAPVFYIVCSLLFVQP
jgi:phosphatidate cytidylyltransferase